MPRRERTGSRNRESGGGQAPGSGKGRGAGRGRGGGRRRRGEPGIDPEGYCICPNCGEKAPHELGSSCREQKCPLCGTPMIRE